MFLCSYFNLLFSWKCYVRTDNRLINWKWIRSVELISVNSGLILVTLLIGKRGYWLWCFERLRCWCTWIISMCDSVVYSLSNASRQSHPGYAIHYDISWNSKVLGILIIVTFVTPCFGHVRLMGNRILKIFQCHQISRHRYLWNCVFIPSLKK